jgi:hypothetical protein
VKLAGILMLLCPVDVHRLDDLHDRQACTQKTFCCVVMSVPQAPNDQLLLLDKVPLSPLVGRGTDWWPVVLGSWFDCLDVVINCGIRLCSAEKGVARAMATRVT